MSALLPSTVQCNRAYSLISGSTCWKRPCLLSVEEVTDTQLVCQTGSSSQTSEVPLRVLFGKAERTVPNVTFRYLDDPVITDATPAESFYA